MPSDLPEWTTKPRVPQGLEWVQLGVDALDEWCWYTMHPSEDYSVWDVTDTKVIHRFGLSGLDHSRVELLHNGDIPAAFERVGLMLQGPQLAKDLFTAREEAGFDKAIAVHDLGLMEAERDQLRARVAELEGALAVAQADIAYIHKTAHCGRGCGGGAW